MPIIPGYDCNPFYASICTGIFSGLGLTIVYLRGGSTGGTDFLVMAIRKLFPHLTIGQISLVVDAIVIIAGGFVFRNLDAVILGMISSIVTTMVIDKIMYGLGAGKLMLIVTSCVLPVLVLLFLLWIVKMRTGIDFNLPKRKSTV